MKVSSPFSCCDSNDLQLANQALHEMGSSANELMHIHWRHGEATCRVEKPALHENFDFCWGTSGTICLQLSCLPKVFFFVADLWT